MIFNPIFLQSAGQTETIDLPKQLKLNSPGYLFSDIIKIVGASSQNQIPSDASAIADSIKLIQSGLQNILQNLNLNQKSLSSENNDLINPNDVSVSKDIATIIKAIQDSLNPISSESKIIKKQSAQLIPTQVPVQIDNSIPSGNLNLLTLNDKQSADSVESSINNITKDVNVDEAKLSSDSTSTQNKKIADNLLLSINSGNPIALNISLNGSNYLIKFSPVDDNGNINEYNINAPKILSISDQNNSFNQPSNKISLSNLGNSASQQNNKESIESLLKGATLQTNEPEIKTADTSEIIPKKSIQQQPAEVLLQPEAAKVNNPLVIPETTTRDIKIQQTLSSPNSAGSNQFTVSNLNILKNYFKTGKFNLQYPIKKTDTTNSNLFSGKTSITNGTNSSLNPGSIEKSGIQISSDSLSNTIKSNHISFSFINKLENNSGSQVITLNNNEDITALNEQPAAQNILVTVEKLNTPTPSNANQYEIQIPKAEKENWIKVPSDNYQASPEIKITDNKTADIITSMQPEVNPVEKFFPDNFNPIDINTTKANSQQLNQILPKSNVVIQPDSIVKNMEELYSQNNYKQTNQSTNEPSAQIIAKPVEDQKAILQNSQDVPIANTDQSQNSIAHTFAHDPTIVKNAGETKQDFTGDESFKQNDNPGNLQKSNTKKDVQPDSKVPESLNFLHDLTSVNKSNLPQNSISTSSESIRTVKPSDLPNEVSNLLQSSDTKSVILNLDPDSLGKVKIVLDLTDKSVRANIQVENEGAKQAVQNNINELKQSLNLNGLQLGSINISLNNNDDKTNKSLFQKKKSSYNQYNSKVEAAENSISSKSMGYNTYDYLI